MRPNTDAPLIGVDNPWIASGYDAAQTFLWIAVILLAARLSSLVERFGQHAVLGELLIGVILGNLVTHWHPYLRANQERPCYRLPR